MSKGTSWSELALYVGVLVAGGLGGCSGAFHEYLTQIKGNISQAESVFVRLLPYGVVGATAGIVALALLELGVLGSVIQVGTFGDSILFGVVVGVSSGAALASTNLSIRFVLKKVFNYRIGFFIERVPDEEKNLKQRRKEK